MDIKVEAEIKVLKLRLEVCEDELINIEKISVGEAEQHIFYLIDERAKILNRMFCLHATEHELRRFQEVNERLILLSEDFHQWHLQMYQFMSQVHTVDGGALDWITGVSPEISEPDNLMLMEEDDFYGSRWGDMFKIIMDNSENDCMRCVNEEVYIGHENIDKWLDTLLLKDIEVCNLFYALCSIKFSIPDVLRIQHFKYNYAVRVPFNYDVIPVKI